MCRKSPIGSQAFTTTEMVIVLTIILLVIAITVPVLLSVRRNAEITLCESNLRQIGMSVEYYRSDNHRAFPVATLMPPPFEVPLQPIKVPLYDSLKFYLQPNSGIYRSPGDLDQVFDRCAAYSPRHFGISYAYYIFPSGSPTTRLIWDYVGDSLHGMVLPFHPRNGAHELNQDGSVAYIIHKSGA